MLQATESNWLLWTAVDLDTLYDMGKTMYTKMAPMTAKEKRSRDAEVSSVLRFMQKHAVVTTPKTVYVKTKRVKDMDDGVAASASLVQKRIKRKKKSIYNTRNLEPSSSSHIGRDG